MSQADIIFYWVFSLFAGLTVVAGKLGRALFGMAEVPPDDARQAIHWKRKRLWLTISELSALPAFATIGVTVTVYFRLEPLASVLIAMVLGALGFGFFLNALQDFMRKKLEIEK